MRSWLVNDARAHLSELMEAALDGEPQRVTRLQSNARLLHGLLPKRTEVQADPDCPIFSVNPATPSEVATVQQALLETGIYPSFIRYLRGPAEGFYRFAVLADHQPAEIRRLAAALSNW